MLDAPSIRGIGVGEQLADVAQAGGAEHGVHERVRRHVGVGVSGETLRVAISTPPSTSVPRRRSGARRSRRPTLDVSFGQSHESKAPASGRSAGVVILTLAGVEGTTTTRRPACSSSAASSVTAAGPRRA